MMTLEKDGNKNRKQNQQSVFYLFSVFFTILSDCFESSSFSSPFIISSSLLMNVGPRATATRHLPTSFTFSSISFAVSTRNLVYTKLSSRLLDNKCSSSKQFHWIEHVSAYLYMRLLKQNKRRGQLYLAG